MEYFHRPYYMPSRMIKSLIPRHALAKPYQERNIMDNQIPTFRNMYYMDYTMKSSVSMIFGSLLFQGITYFGFEQFYPPVVGILAALTVIGVMMLIYRYNLIVSTFRDGITVMAKIHDLETITSRDSKNRYKSVYYGRFSYSVQGETHEIRTRIADNPALMGLKKGGEVELVLREEKPKLVFIKMLYF